MADQPEETQSIDSGGARLFDWFLLPLLSMCSCGREETNEEIVIHGASAPIDAQPEGRSLSEEGPEGSEIAGDSEGSEGLHMRSDVTNINGPPSDFTCRDNEQPLTRFRSPSICNGLSTVSDIDSPIGLRSIDNEDTSLFDQLRLSDLPMLPLLAICGFLRTDGPCKDLYNFRQTCRSFAVAVNTFFQKPQNLPVLDVLAVRLGGSDFQLVAEVESINYLMHPLRADRVMFSGKTGQWMKPKTRITGRFNIDNEEEIERAAQLLRGPVRGLGIMFNETPLHLDILRKLLSNVLSLEEYELTFDNLTDELGSFALSIIPERSMPAVEMEVGRGDMIDAPAFFDRLYSRTRRVHFNIPYTDSGLLLGQSMAFWTQWLLQLLQDGCQVMCDGRPFTVLTVLEETPLDIEWSKQ